jgi:replicative DNA helicase
MSYGELQSVIDTTSAYDVKKLDQYLDRWVELRKIEYLKSLDIPKQIENGKTADEIKGEVLKVIEYHREKAKVLSLNEAIPEFKNYLQFNNESSIYTGYPTIDSNMAIRKTNLVILSARPKVGKTSFAINMMKNIATKGHKVLFFSFEMSVPEISQRLLSCVAGKNINSVSDLESPSLIQVESLPIGIVEATSMNVFEIKNTIISYKPDIVFIDQLDCLPINAKKDRHDIAVGENVIELKKICMELKTPIVLLHQINREGGKNEIPQLHNLKDSGAIEQKADIVLMLWRKDQIEQSEVICRIGANRMGKECQVRFVFDTASCRLIEGGISNNDDSPFG